MRSSAIVSALLAVCALASPINKREYVTELVIVTITDYVYPGEALPTAGSAVQNNQPSGDSTTSVDAAPSSTSVAAPPPVAPSSSLAPAAPPTSTPEPDPATSAPPATSAAPESTAPPASSAAPATSAAPASSVAPASQVSNGAPTTLVANLDDTSPTYAAIALEHHNVHRANHSAQAVTYNATLAQWAQAKAKACVWDESMPPGASGVGMNIAQGTNLAPGSLASVVSDMWYNGEILQFPAYGQANLDTSGEAFQGWGHFSQVVWSTTESIGCGTSQCGPGTSIGSGYFTACLYYPPGNFLGEFTDVGKPLGKPTVGVVGNNVVGL